MENFAGYLAYTDAECGRLLQAVRESPDGDNTLIFCIVGDNGASSEGGFTGTTNEVMNLNGIPSRLEDNMKIIDDIFGPDTEPHCPLGWAWAGNAPFQWVKQVASHLGGSRNPMRGFLARADQGRRRHSQSVYTPHRRHADDPRCGPNSGTDFGRRNGAKTA